MKENFSVSNFIKLSVFLGITFQITPASGQSTFSPSPKDTKDISSISKASTPSSQSSASSSATGESTFQRSKRRESILAISTNISSSREVPELREKEETQRIGNIWDGPSDSTQLDNTKTTKSPQGRMKFSQYRFGMRASFLNISSNAAGIFVNFPFRQVQSTTAGFETGSEFGGSEIGIDAYSRGLALLKISYVDRRSKKLNLLASHQGIKTGLYFENGGQRRVFSDMLIQLGPELEFPLKKNSTDSFASYGNKLGGFAMISADIGLTRMDSIRITTESRFTRVDSYKYKGQERGGAGLGVATGRIEYGMNESLWLGGFYEYPYVKPLGRESHFGDTELAGLLGPTAGFTIRGEAF